MADINIYGKLVNQTPDGVLADASQVYDTEQNAHQNALNARLATALQTIAELQQRLSALEGGTSGGSSSGCGIINLNASDRDTTYTLDTAIAAITSPPYGAILMFVGDTGQWQMWHYTGRDYTDTDDWEPVGVILSTSSVFLDSSGNATDCGLTAADGTVWSAN